MECQAKKIRNEGKSSMSGSENISRPSADLAREKTEASIKAAKLSGKTSGAVKNKGDNCDAVKKMVSFENELGNISPNATNISH